VRAATAVGLIVLAGCGYVGDPLPPALHVPARIADLRVVQSGANLEIYFTLPEQAVDGVGIRRLAEVELMAGNQRVDVAMLDPGPARADHPVARLAGQKVGFRIRTQSLKGKWSDWSPVTEVEVVPEVERPAEVRAESHPSGVRLSWRVPAGYQVQVRRKGASGEFEDLATAAGSEWIDTGAPMETPQVYTVQARHPKGALSAITGELAVTPRDTFPPSVPEGLTGVPGINSVELAWDRSLEADTAGYLVYRAVGGGEFAVAGPQSAAASFSDRNVKAGAIYRYAVSSVDQKGNESKRSAVVEVTAP